MARYINRGGDSGVVTYEITPNSITVGFRDGSSYLYTDESAGMENIQQMKRLAGVGQGLNAFINRYVRKRYERKLS
jgi:hypothetical protein